MYRLIIADDEPRIRRGLIHRVPWAELGFEVVGEAANGKEALVQMLETRPHLVITDIKMPEMDGLKLISSIRDLGISALVIIISGYADFEYARQAIRYGVTEYLLKPIEEDALYDSVLNCIKLLEPEPAQNYAAGQDCNRQNSPVIKAALAFLENNYSKDVTLNNIAKAVSVHPNYLSGLFTKEVGKSFSRYLAELRIDKSKELLQNPALKIYEVAEMSGFSDYRWFAKLFKQIEGVTPGEYKATAK